MRLRREKNKKICVSMAFIFIALLCFSGCGGSTAVMSNETGAIVVKMQTVGKGDLILHNSFVGTVMPRESVYVIPFVSGTVTEVNYEVGDWVEEGAVLFRIDDEGARLQLRQAELTYINTKQQADMATGSQQTSTDLQLEGNKIQAQSSYEQAQLAYYQLLNKYDEAEQAVSDLEKQVEENKEQIDIYQKKVDSFENANSVSSGNLVQEYTSNVQTLQTLQTQQALLEYQLSEAKSGFQQLKDSIPQAESAYRAAEAALNLVGETENLTQGAVRSDTKAQLSTGLELAQLGVDSAKLALSYYTVKAPISGTITSCGVSVNGVATSSSPAFVISGGNGMKVSFGVGESVKNTLSIGDVITVERSGMQYSGSITAIGNAVSQQTGLFQVDANVNASFDVLPGGVSVKITADTYKEKDTIVIPYDSVYYDNEGTYVYLCIAGKAVKTRVLVGIFDDTSIAVTDGVNIGDILITSWSARLLDGVEVVEEN